MREGFLMPERVRIIKPIKTFIPKPSRKAFGVFTVDGVEVQEDCAKTSLIFRVTDGASEAVLKVNNSSNKYSKRFTGGEDVVIKMDYVDGSTDFFKGWVVIPKPKFDRVPFVELTCYDYGYAAVRKKDVTKKYTISTDIGQIFKELVEEFLPGFTTAGVNTSTGIIATPIWQFKSLWDCFKELATIHPAETGKQFDFYCSTEKDWQFYERGTRTSNADALVFGQNISKTSIDETFIKKANRIVVIGNSIKGQLNMHTVDAADQTPFVMSEVIRNTNLTTHDEVVNYAVNELANRNNIGTNGTVTTKSGELNILAGYRHWIFDPYNGLNDYYNISEVKHEIESQLITTVKFYEYHRSNLNTEQILNDTVSNTQSNINVENEFNMEKSFILTFDNNSQIDSDSDSNVGVANGRLVLTSGTTGTFISTDETASSNVSSFVLRVNGSGYDTATFYVSLNDGGDYQAITPNVKYDSSNFTKPMGTGIKVKIDMVASTSIESMGVEYK
jgi:hypothetical protein